MQEFALLFTIFDETKSWYFTENMERNCRSPCHIQREDPFFRENYRFHGNIPNAVEDPAGRGDLSLELGIMHWEQAWECQVCKSQQMSWSR